MVPHLHVPVRLSILLLSLSVPFHVFTSIAPCLMNFSICCSQIVKTDCDSHKYIVSNCQIFLCAVLELQINH